MSQIVKIGEAKTRLSELVAKAEAGEEFVIARGNQPVARLVPFGLERPARRRETIEKIRVFRDHVRVPTSIEELRAWRDEGRRY